MAAMAVHLHKKGEERREQPNSFQPVLGKAHLERLARTKDAKLLEEKVRWIRQRVSPSQ
jgi:hypothetical protein